MTTAGAGGRRGDAAQVDGGLRGPRDMDVQGRGCARFLLHLCLLLY